MASYIRRATRGKNTNLVPNSSIFKSQQKWNLDSVVPGEHVSPNRCKACRVGRVYVRAHAWVCEGLRVCICVGVILAFSHMSCALALLRACEEEGTGEILKR